mgnify:CR=1 FL=1
MSLKTGNTDTFPPVSSMKGYEAPKIVVKPPGPKTKAIIESISRSVEAPSLAKYIASAEVIPAKNEGPWIEDPDGNVYIDFLSMHSVANVGRQHPKVIEACKQQLDRVLLGWFEETAKHLALVRKLAQITPGNFPKQVFLGLSGSDANECSIKLVHWSTRRPYVVSFMGAYHGMTHAAQALTSTNVRMRRGYHPLIPDVVTVPYPYCYRCPFKLERPECGLQCLKYIEDWVFQTFLPPDEVAAITIEPIQGDAGWIVPPDGYLQELKKLCEKNGIPFIAEEVQSGFGRSGKMFACEHWKIEPDIILLGKAMASGMPISACVAKTEIAQPSGRKDDFFHGFSTSANSVCCAAALATIEVIEKERLVKRSAKVGEHILKRLNEMKEKHRIIGDVRGKGLMIGVELVKNKETKEPGTREAAKVCRIGYETGLAMIAMGIFDSVLRIHPPLVITEEQADKGLELLEAAINRVEKE